VLAAVRADFADRTGVVLLSGAAAFGAVLLGLGSVAAPLVALAGAIGVVFATITFRNLAAGLALFTVLSFFDRATALTQTGLSPVKITGLALALIWALVAINRVGDVPLLPREYPKFAFVTTAFAGWALVSALWAEDSLRAGSTAFRLVLSAVLVFIVFSAIREARHVHWLVAAFIVGAFAGQLIGFLGLYAADPGEEGRLAGGFDDPNELAAVLVAALPIAGFAFAAYRKTSFRWLLAGATALFGFALLRTDSQAGILALGVALVLSLVFAGRARRLVVAAVVSLALVVTPYYTFVTPPVLVETISSSENVGARESVWTAAVAMAKDHPIVGVGAGNYVTLSPSYTLDDLNLPRADMILKGEIVHNTYLEVLTEFGPIGLFMLLGLIVAAFVLYVRAVRGFERAGEWELEMVTRGAMIGTAAMLAASIFATATYEKQLWLLLALAPALHALSRRSLGASDTLSTSR
jgi:O-antigen ligase